MPTWTLELRSPDRNKDVHVVLRGLTIVASDVDAARKEAKRLLAQRGFAKLRALNFNATGGIVAYLPGPTHSGRKTPGATVGSEVTETSGTTTTTVRQGGHVAIETPVWKRPPGPRRKS
jgi:hypothetical protein